MNLYVATSNPGKLRDFAHAAQAFPNVQILPLPNLDQIPTPEETADTFGGNALIKALAYGQLAPHEIIIADDSGISVRGLNGAPGVRSARYADDERFDGPGTADERNNACLLNRAAKLRYRDISYLCSLAAVRDGQLLATAYGELQGRLMDAPRGTLGFGYDPIFEVLELNQTMAEVDPETRLRMSHRGRALVKLIRILNTDIAQTRR
jgi:XTP/dITP diphosphohydrolase